MSTIKVNKIENTSTTDGGISIDNSGHVQIDGQQLPSVGALSNRNLIINGAMQVDQRGTSTGITTADYYAVDRMRFSEVSLTTAQFTREQSTDAPDGFSSSLKVTTTTAEGSVAAADAYRPLNYRIEGQDLQQLQYGTSGAKSLTLSFYVKSSVTGTYGLTFARIETQDRLITATYNISSANTWEYKTITIPGDTSSSITNDNAKRFEIQWSGGSGTDRTATDTSGSWTDLVSSGYAFGHSSSVQLQNTLNSTWQITGVQLEVGSVATPFEHRSYGDELARCQRYYQGVDTRNEAAEYYSFGVGMWVSAGKAYCEMSFQTEMRALPTSIEASAANTFFVNSGSTNISNFTTIALSQQGRNSAIISLSGGSGGTNGRSGRWLSNNNNTAYCFFSAEL